MLLNLASAAFFLMLQDLGLCLLPVVGLAKPRGERKKGRRDTTDRIVLPDIRDPIRLRANNPALRLLQQIRDETHDQAVRYHRQVRRRRALRSALEELPGIGPARRKALLRHFGSARGVIEASREELEAAPGLGPTIAASIHAALHPKEDEPEPET